MWRRGARHAGVPAEHDGSTAFDIRFHLSAEPASVSVRIGGGWTSDGVMAARKETRRDFVISRARDDGSGATIHSDDPASRGGAASGDVSPTAATGVGVLRRGLALGLVALAALVFAVPSEAQNSAPTGKPTIDGTPHAGEILTASVSGIADADGLTTPGYTYQWRRVLNSNSGGGTSNLAGATASTYTLTGDDVTHRVQVRVMFTDDGGNAETVTSDIYPSSGQVLTLPGAPDASLATAGDGRVRLDWGSPSPTNTGGVPGTTLRYQSRYAPGSTVPAGTAWSNPTKFVQTRRLIDGLTNGTAYAFEVRAVNPVGGGPPATATATPMTVACPAPVLGNRHQRWRGDLTIDARTPPNGEAPAFFGFFALRDPPGGSLSDTDFTLGAQAYGITAAWAGDVVSSGVFVSGDLVFGFDRDLTEAHRAALRLHVCGTAYDFSAGDGPDFEHTYLWPDDLDWEVLPRRTLSLSLPPNNAATGTPAVSGAAQTAEVLTAATGTIADADGLTLADAAEAGFAYTYQWLRVDADGTSNPTDIPGATDARYTVTAADMGKKLKVRASFTDDFNANEARTSDAYPSSGTVSRGKVVIGFRGVSVLEDVLWQLSFPEDVGTAVLTVYLDRSLETALSVPWFTSDQTAVSPDDYTGGPGTLTFAPGEIEQTISLPIVDDAIREDPDPVYGEDESLLVSLEFGDDYRLKNSGVVMVLILDNDGDDPVTPAAPGVTVSPSTLTVDEGTTVTYTVRLDSEPTGTVTLTPSSDNPDVTFLPATLTFTPSTWDTAQTVTVTAAQDTDTAEDTATISHAVAGEDYGSVMAPSVPVTVPDDDVDPDPDPDPGPDPDPDPDDDTDGDTGGSAPTSLTLTADRTPAEGGLDVTLTATLDTPAPTGGTTVTLTAGGTADGGGTDYTLSSTTITLAEGETAGTVTLTVIDDSEIEDGETIVLGAESTTPVLTAPPLTLTIADNDAVPDEDDPAPPTTLTLSHDPAPAEGGGPVTVTAALDAPAPTGGTTVTLTAGGTADGGGTDYTLSSTTITLAEGETAGTVTLTVIDDSEIEDGETIVLGAESTTPVLTAPPLTLTIADNDAVPDDDAVPVPALPVGGALLLGFLLVWRGVVCVRDRAGT